MKAFVTSHVSYCPLTWMFHRRNMELYTNKIHERALKLIYDAPNLSVEELLLKDESVSIHQRNLQS